MCSVYAITTIKWNQIIYKRKKEFQLIHVHIKIFHSIDYFNSFCVRFVLLYCRCCYCSDSHIIFIFWIIQWSFKTMHNCTLMMITMPFLLLHHIVFYSRFGLTRGWVQYSESDSCHRCVQSNDDISVIKFYQFQLKNQHVKFSVVFCPRSNKNKNWLCTRDWTQKCNLKEKP